MKTGNMCIRTRNSKNYAPRCFYRNEVPPHWVRCIRKFIAMQININVCKKVSVSYVAQTGSLTVDFESQGDNALATLLSGGNFRARFFLRRMFTPIQPNEPQAQAEQRGAQKAAEYKQQLEQAIAQDGVKIAHGVFTVSELSGGTMNAISAPRADGMRVIMSSLTRDAIVSQDTVDENLQTTLLNEAKSVFNQGIANGRYMAAQAVYQPVQVGAQPVQQPQNPLAGLQAAAPEQQPGVQQPVQQPIQQPVQAPQF